MVDIYNCAVLEVTPPALLGLLLLDSGIQRVLPQDWPVASALDVLAARVNDTTPLGRVVARWPREANPSKPQFKGMRAMLRALALRGALRACGTGWDAGYEPTCAWLESHASLQAALPRRDRAALSAARRQLVAALSTWSKNAVASLPNGSVTSTSYRRRRGCATT